MARLASPPNSGHPSDARARSSIINPAEDPSGPQHAEIAAFLKANPGFLQDNPALYEVLRPPKRIYGAATADHMAAMVAAARTRATRAEAAAADAAARARATEGFARRVQDAVLALLRAPDPVAATTHELPALLHLDAARLCSEAPTPPPGAAPVSPGTVAAALGSRAALLGPSGPALAATLHGEAVALAEQQALVRVPLRGGPALLALACRSGVGLAGATTDALTFLGKALATRLDHP